MERENLQAPMTAIQKVLGWIYLPVHIFGLPLLIPSIVLVLSGFGVSLTYTQVNFVYYFVSFIFLGILMMGYLRESFFDMCDRVLHSLKCIFVSLVFYYGAAYCVNFVLAFFLTDLVNPNTGAIMADTKLNGKSMFAVSVLLAPIVEEILFRGVVFGTIRGKSRAAAYIVSTLVFSVYHLWQYAVTGYEIKTLLLYLLQYLPGSVFLAKCFEDSGSIWPPIFMHMIINYIALTVAKLV